MRTLLQAVWSAYDDLHEALLSKLPWNEDYDNLEEAISQEFEPIINSHLDSFLPVYVQHGPSERESRRGGAAKPPEYDIAFVWRGDRRLMWPLEAKVLKSDADTATNLRDYLDTVSTRFLACVYAPFSSGGAMVAYLRDGDPDEALRNIATRMGSEFTSNSDFPTRCHKISTHQRVVPHGKDYPVSFRLHHLAMPLFDTNSAIETGE